MAWWKNRERAEADRRELERLEATAGAALVRTDERVRLADDELGFAVAELGETETTELAGALQRARERLGEAFHLHQLLHDHVPETDEQRREWFTRIIGLCESAETVLGEQAAAVATRRASLRRTPSAIEQVRAEVARVQGEIDEARQTLARLADRYTDDALLPVADNPAQAARLLEFAERSAEVAGKRLAAQQPGEADAAARAAAETAQRADGLLHAVAAFEIEALRAEAALGAMIAESRTEIASARALPGPQRAGAIDAAIAALESALAELPHAGEPSDPVSSLTRVRRANTALDDAVRDRFERDERSRRVQAQLGPALDDAERQVAGARAVVDDYRAPVGPDARTRLAEAERELAVARAATDAERALHAARRAAALAAEAASLAHRDIARSGVGQRWDGGWNGPGGDSWGGRPYGRPGGSGGLGAVLGGMVLGGILDDLGDLGDFGDF